MDHEVPLLAGMEESSGGAQEDDNGKETQVQCKRDLAGSYRLCAQIFRFRRAKLVTVEPVMFLFMLGTYLYLALIELYYYQQYGLEALRNSSFFVPNGSFCVNSSLLDSVIGNGTDDTVQTRTSQLILITSFCGQITSVVVVLVAGPLSDRFGRKPILCFALMGSLLAAVFNLLIVLFKLDMHYFVGSGIIMGSTGGFSVVMTVSVAYLADVSSKRWLTVRIAILQAMLYISQALSDALTGQWLKRTGCYFDPLLWLILSSSVLVLLYLPWIPEPLSKEERLERFRMEGGIGALLVKGFRIFLCRGYSRWRLWCALLVLAVTVINGIGAFELLTLFQIRDPLNWDPGKIGWYGLINTVAQAFSLFVLLPLLIAFHIPDSLIVLMGVLISSGMNFFIAFLKTSWEMFLVGVLQGLDPALSPIIRAILSKLVAQKDQGALFAIVTSVQVLCASFSSVFYNTVYQKSLANHLNAGLAFIIMGILGLVPVPLVVALLLFRKKAAYKDSDTAPIPQDEEKEQLVNIQQENEKDA